MTEEDSDRQNMATEAPTPRRRERARSEGQVVHSQELATSGHLLMAWLALTVGGPVLGELFAQGLQDFLKAGLAADWTLLHSELAARNFLGRLVRGVGPVVTLMLCSGLLLEFAQQGWRISWRPWRWRWEALDPARGWQKLFSMQTSLKAGWTLLRLLGLFAVAGWCFWSWRGRFIGAGAASTGELVSVIWNCGLELLWALAWTTLLIGGADYLAQWWRNERRLRMTREELKQELKEETGDPYLRTALRKRQRARIQARSIQKVPEATVVITNPTHVAVAVKYELDTMAAPVILAKGTGELAQRIKEKARMHGVPLVENRPLARALCQSVEVGQPIPVEFYRAVAEILSRLFQPHGV